MNKKVATRQIKRHLSELRNSRLLSPIIPPPGAKGASPVSRLLKSIIIKTIEDYENNHAEPRNDDLRNGIWTI